MAWRLLRPRRGRTERTETTVGMEAWPTAPVMLIWRGASARASVVRARCSVLGKLVSGMFLSDASCSRQQALTAAGRLQSAG
jgi:hypothetical protein